MPSTDHITPFAAGIALVQFMRRRKRQATEQVLRVWWKGMHIVLS